MRIHSIRVKITAITIVAILTSILAVFVACNTTIQAENDRRSVEMMNLIGQDTQKSLEKFFESIEQSVEMAGNMASDTMDSVMLVECAEGGAEGRRRAAEQTARMDAYLEDYCADIEEAFSSVATHTYGVVSYYYTIAPELSRTQHGFFCSKVGKTGFVQREALDAQKLDPADQDYAVWYYTPLQRGRPSWVGPYKAQAMGDLWIYSYLVPVYKSGTLLGVLGMDIPVETLTAQVRSIKVYDTGFACLFDAEGRVLYHPEMTFHGEPGAEDTNFPVQELGRESNGDSLIVYTRDNQRRQMSFSTLANGMKLAVVAPEREINAPWMQLTHILLLATLLIVAVFAALVLFVMRIITSPLLRLTAASRRLADADYDVELSYESQDEVGELTRSFVRMRDQLKLYIEDLNQRIYTDDLTGLPNMRYFLDLALQERERLLRNGERPVMLYFNLIGMKHFNRQYGLEEGDKLIQAIAEILRDYYGDRCLSRYGQDHFAVVTREEGLEEGLEAIFRDCLRANGGRTLPVRVGIYQDQLGEVGVSVACDRAKYASDQHRDSFVSGYYYFDRTMLRQVENLRYIINHLDQALEEGWVQVYYQPIVRAANGRVCDEEALSRWFDPVKGMLSPGEFIPILENCRLIYKLDLYVLEEILRKMKAQRAEGMPVVPHSLNLSRVDFEVCDIVEEVRRRVDQACIARDRLTIEVTESVIGSNFEFMKAQIERFQSLGFQVWMDDFGSGYSSLDVLQDIHFDLIKFDMRFMHRFGQGDESKIILTELIRMAIGLGTETICEGVESEEQKEFLREVGCTKLQGYYFSRPNPFEEIVARKREGRLIGFENPEESFYYETIGRVNLYDLAVLANMDESVFQDYFNTLPMGIVEVQGDEISFVRTNQAYRSFIKRFFHVDLSDRGVTLKVAPNGPGRVFMNGARQCCEDGQRVFLDEQMDDGSSVHSFIRLLGTNPVTGTDAVAVAVLSVKDPDAQTTYADIARALASDYYSIYVVDLDTERFIEYSSVVGREELAEERHGEQFFAVILRDARARIYEEDRERFLASFTKENILHALDEQGVYSATYRVVDTGSPMRVAMKINRMRPEGRQIIIGVSLLDATS